MGQEQEQHRHIVAGAVLASEQVEEFSLVEPLAALAFVLTKLSGLLEDFFMGNSP